MDATGDSKLFYFHHKFGHFLFLQIRSLTNIELQYTYHLGPSFRLTLNQGILEGLFLIL